MRKILIGLFLGALMFSGFALGYTGQVIPWSGTYTRTVSGTCTTASKNVRTCNYSTVVSGTVTGSVTDTDGTPPPPPPPPPSIAAPSNLRVSAITTTSVRLDWDAVSGATNYRLYLDGTLVGQGSGCSGTCTYWTYSGLQPSTTYSLGVEAQDATSTSARSTISATTSGVAPPPPPPAAQCADGLDNDSDGLVDLADPGCSSSTDNDETNTAPPPPTSGTVAPGQSWQVAYDAAPALGIVRVLAGNHPTPFVQGTKKVTFLGDEGAVALGGIDVWAPINMENVDIDTADQHGQFTIDVRVASVSFKNVNVTGNAPSLHAWEPDFIWDGGVMTHRDPNGDGINRYCGLDSGVPLWLNNDRQTVQNFEFKPWTEDDPACMHGEDIRVQGGDDVVIRNVTFACCTDAGSGHLFVTTTSATDSNLARRLLVEGNTFHPVIGTYAIQVSNWTDSGTSRYRNNQFDQPPLIMGTAPMQTCGNTGQVPASWSVPCP